MRIKETFDIENITQYGFTPDKTDYDEDDYYIMDSDYFYNIGHSYTLYQATISRL